MPRADVQIKTRDGICPASVFTPAGKSGPFPGVLFFMDGLGIRPALNEMAQHLADAGYLVLLPDLYYRNGPYAPMIPSQVFSDPKSKENLMKLIGTLGRDRKISDAGAFIDFLSNNPDVKGPRFAATGYCMGGNVALTVAGALPEKLKAVASFHGGGLATDSADSPHLFVQNILGYVYVAGATEDANFTPQQKSALEQALTKAAIPHLVETYEGAHHGFAVPDHPAHNAAAADRHWNVLFNLFRKTFAS